MKECKNYICRKDITSDAVFCPYCGACQGSDEKEFYPRIVEEQDDDLLTSFVAPPRYHSPSSSAQELNGSEKLSLVKPEPDSQRDKKVIVVSKDSFEPQRFLGESEPEKNEGDSSVPGVSVIFLAIFLSLVALLIASAIGIPKLLVPFFIVPIVIYYFSKD